MTILAPFLLILLTPVTTYSNCLATVSAAYGAFKHIAVQPLLPGRHSSRYIIAGAAGLVEITVVGAIVALVVGRLLAFAWMFAQSPYAHLRRSPRNSAGSSGTASRRCRGSSAHAAYGQAGLTRHRRHDGEHLSGYLRGGRDHRLRGLSPCDLPGCTRIFYDSAASSAAHRLLPWREGRRPVRRAVRRFHRRRLSCGSRRCVRFRVR